MTTRLRALLVAAAKPLSLPVCLVLLGAVPAAAQSTLRSALGPAIPLVSLTSPASLNARLRLEPAPARAKTGHVLAGGLIGAATGVVACTAISNLAKDRGTGFSTCTTKGYLGFAVGGFALGAIVGAIIK